MSYGFEAAEIAIGNALDENDKTAAISNKLNVDKFQDFILDTHGESIWKRIINHEPSIETSIWQGQLLTFLCSL